MLNFKLSITNEISSFDILPLKMYNNWLYSIEILFQVQVKCTKKSSDPFEGEEGLRAKGNRRTGFVAPVFMQAFFGLITFRLSVSTD